MTRISRKLPIREKIKFLSIKLRISFLRTLFSFFVPGGLLILGVAILLHRGITTQALPILVRIYPYVVLAAGVWVGWRFKRSRLLFVILVLAIADRSLLHFAGGGAASMGVGRIVYNAVSILLPLNLVVLSLMKERGFMTWQSKWPLGLILFQVLLVALICFFQQLGLGPYLEYSFVELPLFSLIPLGQPGLLAFGVASFILLVGYIQHRGSIECGFLWTLVSSFFALALNKIGPVSTIYFATAGLVLVISVIETSFYLAFHDDLTGLPARRAMNDTLSKLGRHFTVAMIDIDYFKKLNDRYGQFVGDQILRIVSSKLVKITGGGIAFRCSSQRFAVIFPDKFVDETIPHLESLRKGVEIYGFILRHRKRPRKKPHRIETASASQKRVSITISIGVAEREESHSKAKQVVKEADNALYRAKKAGHNQIVTSSPETPVSIEHR